MGAGGEVSTSDSEDEISQWARTSSNVAIITAKGLWGRRLRSRSRATASAFVASHANWNPPSPLTAKISPANRRTFASLSASWLVAAIISPSADSSQRCGPQTGQAFGWAWNRRSVGSSYSARQLLQSGKTRMVVLGRS